MCRVTTHIFRPNCLCDRVLKSLANCNNGTCALRETATTTSRNSFGHGLGMTYILPARRNPHSLDANQTRGRPTTRAAFSLTLTKPHNNLENESTSQCSCAQRFHNGGNSHGNHEDSMNGTVSLEFRLNPVNGWFIRAFANPVVKIDGGPVPASWKNRGVYSLALGRHVIAASLMYRGTTILLGTGELDFELTQENQECSVIARNGLMNQTPFHLSAR